MPRPSVSKEKKSSTPISTGERWRIEEEGGLGAEATYTGKINRREIERRLRSLFFSYHRDRDPNQNMVLKKIEKEKKDASVQPVRKSGRGSGTG